MQPYNASQTQFWLEVSGQPPETFTVVEFYGSEAISLPFRYEVRLLAPEDNDLNLPEFLNKPATLTILRGDEKINQYGILSDLEEVGRSKDFASYVAVFVPRLWKLQLNYQSRVFQSKSVPDIITEVLKGSGFSSGDYKLQLKRSYQPREYCVQYRETDLNFISRLLEYEGMYYYFDHADGKDVLTIIDDKSSAQKVESPDEISSYTGDGSATSEEEIVSELTHHERVVTGKVVLKDYNYRTPETNLSAESRIDPKSPGIYYEYGEHFKTVDEGKVLAKIRNEEIEAGRRVITGAGNCRGFHAGYKFALTHHYRDSLNGNYLITQVDHSGSQTGATGESDGGGGSSYTNKFTCIPADIQYRPPRATPQPRIPGIMTAKIESAGGDYAHLDDQGRYRVKMPFDMSDKGKGSASRPIRLAQPYSGTGYGIHFPNLANTEMIWACIDGNIDRPLGLSTVPNPSNSSPSVAGNKAQNVIRTAGQNEMTFDDTKSAENIFIHATKNMAIDVVHDTTETIGHDETSSVGHDRSRKVSGSESIGIDGSRTEHVGKDQNDTIDGTHNAAIGKDKFEQVKGENNSSVGKNSSVSISENLTQSVGKDASVQVGKNLILQVQDDATVEIGKNTTLSSGADLTVNVDKSAWIKAENEIVISCGDASIIMKKNGDITINGKKIVINASGDVALKGSKITQN